MTVEPNPTDFPVPFPEPTGDRFPEAIRRFTEDRSALLRRYPNTHSEARHRRLQSFWAAWSVGLEALPPDGESPSDTVDRFLLKHLVAADQAQDDRRRRRWERLSDRLSGVRSLLALDDERRDHVRQDPRESARILARAAAETESVGASEDQSVTPDTLRVAEALESARKVLESWWTFREGYDPLATWWCAAPVARLDDALKSRAGRLRESIGESLVGDPVGDDGLIEELSRNRIDHTADELMDAARKQMAWCLQELEAAAREMGHGRWQDALEAVKASHVAPGDQPELVSNLAREAEEYVIGNGLLDVPDLARETWRMEMMSPERQKVNPFFLGGETIIVSFPTSTMDEERKQMSLRGNNPAFARATVHHELIPGHHMQQFFGSRYRPYRRIFGTPFWVEGWTLHWEMLLWDRGFARTPAEKIGMLFWRLHRCARVVFSLEYHRGVRSAEECVALLVDTCGHEPDNARAEVRRSISDLYDPLYQCAYLIGGEQVRRLHRERIAAGETDRTFHNRFLRENQMPIAVLRTLMSGDVTEASLSQPWRFLDA